MSESRHRRHRQQNKVKIMKALFVESESFTEWIKHRMSDDTLAELQQELMRHPEAGDLMPGCGGLRKIRTLDPQRSKGKRGGIRVIYLYLPEVRRFFLITAFGKNEKEDLTPQEKRAFTKVAEAIRSEVY